MNRAIHGARLNRQRYPFQLYMKAKRAGSWDPAAIDFSQDAQDAAQLDDRQRQLLTALFSAFYGGEEAVTADLLPMMCVAAAAGDVEDELFLTTYLADEARHAELFDLLLFDVLGASAEHLPFLGAAYERLFGELLPSATTPLLNDASPAAQIRAGAAYQLIVEGVLAETGYHGVRLALEANGIFPATVSAFARLKQDESRHLAWGLYRLDSLLRRAPEGWSVLEDTLAELAPCAFATVAHVFEPFADDPLGVPFGLDPNVFQAYAQAQLAQRLAVLEDARAGKPSRFT
jgi:ribonucleoside-diphosphate reductase beta chain